MANAASTALSAQADTYREDAPSTRVDSPSNQVAMRGAASLDLSEPLRAFLAEAGRPGATRITSLDEAEQIFREHQQAETAHRVMQGWVLASVKAMGEESLRVLSTRVDTSKSSVHQLIAYFYLFQAVPDLDSVHRCAHLEFTIAREVAKWSRDEQIAFCSTEEVRGVTIDQAREMTSREFIAATKPPEVAQLQVQVQNQQNQIAGLEKIIKGLRQQGGVTTPSLPPQYAALRDESVYLTCKMAEEVARLRSESDRLLMDRDWRNQPEAQHRMAVAAHVYHALNGVVVMASELLEQIHLTYSKFVTGDVPPGMQYSPEEKEHLAQLRSAALEAAQAGVRHARATAQNANGVRGRRPKPIA